MIRVLVADESSSTRNALAGYLAGDPEIEVVGQAKGGREAIALAARLRPDVIALDLAMTDIEGVEAVREIMTGAPCRIVAVAAIAASERPALSRKALAAGALELVPRAEGDAERDVRGWCSRVAESIRLMAKIPVITRTRGGHAHAPLPAQTSGAVAAGAGRRVNAFGIVASTGGPQALSTLLALLPSDLCCPLLIAQHMTPGFTAGLVALLSRVTKLKVVTAGEAMPCVPGFAYVAPDGHDLELGAPAVLHVDKSRDRHVPSGNRLLASIARWHGTGAGGAVLTGMGDDGVAGLLAIRRAGGVTFAQDRSSSVVFGMPAEAFERGATSALLPLDAMAAAIRDLGASPTAAKP